jgi:L-histidine N-alpha-methyltransferase
MSRVATSPLLFEETRKGLEAEPKELPSVWLYDDRGSQLYEEITRLPAYYLPRREAEILGVRASYVARRTKARTIVELGSGSAKNTRILLGALAAAGTIERFVPLDVSEHALRASGQAIAAAYPGVAVEPIVGDFERDVESLPGHGPRLMAFLGSTLGNLIPERRATLFATLASELAEDDWLLLGVDLVKQVGRLEAAYEDRAGVTEAFVRNALTAVNRELGATFEQRRFVYEPRWDPVRRWMDIGVRAVAAHPVSVPRLELEVALEKDERLRVEISAKFRRGQLEGELGRAGLRAESWWTDRAGDFAVVLARPEGE